MGHSLGATASAVMMGMMGMRYLKTKKVSASRYLCSEGGLFHALMRMQGGGDRIQTQVLHQPTGRYSSPSRPRRFCWVGA